jgi:hypothetical protein
VCSPVRLAEGTLVFVDCCRYAQVAFATVNNSIVRGLMQVRAGIVLELPDQKV